MTLVEHLNYIKYLLNLKYSLDLLIEPQSVGPNIRKFNGGISITVLDQCKNYWMHLLFESD